VGEYLASFGLDFTRDLFGRVAGVAINHMDREPIAGQAFADGCADPARAASHHRNPSL